MPLRFFLTASLTFAIGVGAPTAHAEDPYNCYVSGFEDARDALAAFNATPPGLSGDLPGLDAEFNKQCMTSTPSCLQYIDEHRESLTAVLPDNPDYFPAFLRTLDAGPPNCPPDGNTSDALNQTDLLETARLYKLWTLLEPSGQRAQDLAHAVGKSRVAYTKSENLLDAMIQIAVTGNLIDGVGPHLYHAAQQNDSDTLRRLETAIRPMSVEELSFRRSFRGEKRFVMDLVRQAEELSPEELYQQRLEQWREHRERYPDMPYDKPEYQTRAELDAEMREHFPGEVLWTRNIDALIALSELPNEAFWTTTEALNYFFATAEEARNISSPAYVDYLKNTRLVDLRLTVLRTLAHRYRHRTSETIPDAAPPAGFQWLWRDDNSELCLRADPSQVPAALLRPQFSDDRNDICSVDWQHARRTTPR